MALKRTLLNDFLGNELCGTHDTGGIDRFIRRNEYGSVYTVFFAKIKDIPGSLDIGEHRFADIGLHEGNMFESGGMEDDVRAKSKKTPVHKRKISDVADDRSSCHARVVLPHVPVDLINAKLRMIKEAYFLDSEG